MTTSDVLARAGTAWLQNGLAEHSSVAAFARLVLHLMSLGAPPDLLKDVIAAMNDEVEHARLCFGLARKFTGVVAGPGKLDLSGALNESSAPGAVLRGAILEGCFGETIAARWAEEALAMTTDGSVRTALATIVPDEKRHAELSWRLVTWIVRVFPELSAVAEETFAEALGGADGVEDDVDFDGMEDYGHLPAPAKRRVREATVAGEITERMIALFGHHPALRRIGLAL